jgi:hypothetical protein
MGTGVLPLRYGALRSGFEENMVLPRERVSGWLPRFASQFAPGGRHPDI